MVEAKIYPSEAELDQIIQALSPKLEHFGPRTVTEIEDLSNAFFLKIPGEYRRFLQTYGTIAGSEIKILGIAPLEKTELAVSNLTILLRLSYTNMPLNLLPIEDLGNGCFAGLVCPEQEISPSPVVLLDLNNLDNPVGKESLASGFTEYLYNRLVLLIEPLGPNRTYQEHLEHGLSVLEKHIQQYNKEFHYDHATGGPLPANHIWRPYRYCIQDVLFGALVVKHDRKQNHLEIDAFLTADVPEYGPLAGAKALTCFLLSEAYKCGGSMEIQFTKEVEGGHIPQQVQELASKYDVNFEKAKQGVITPNEAKKFYMALTDFSENFIKRLREMESNGLVNPVRACYVVHHGVWSKEQVEIIVLGSEHPDQILSGEIQPIQRHLYQHNLFHARSAMLAGFLDRNLNRRNRPEAEDVALDLEDDFRLISFGFDRENYVRLVLCDEDLPIPWLVTEETEHFISAGVKCYILLRARDVVDIHRHLSEDLKQAANLKKQKNAPVFILVPYDFNELDESERLDWLSKFRIAHIGLLVCPETTLLLDAEAAQKLSESRILRQ